ncbi:GAS2-like protein pickled eggs isoform X2 [Cephus cinctus]|nr:GAS2-like protein pickled eggs isoform X2 [Cephus cinctus]XP_015593426.1 GAS2-like protein pickled eggs isoform X2 [Cephus cinctus]XP_015593427.1 GAS2-like protein pickled eggs isoform X2 [Cephus cinctus]XP_015593428.1 GAS2-like protein pickled eggs isoform X2 [Cephus cinctus]XP_024939776.1 GAS2-like protein pickled eggs isoform X2 [Cephus cinctus]
MSVLLEARPYRPFKSSEEYLVAMKEDLAEWLNALYPELRMNLDNFMDRLDTGVALCKHANNVRKSASEYVARRQARKIMTRSITSSLAVPMTQLSDVAFLPNAKAGTFFARDNVSNFISWCRNSLGIIECLLFETDDLILRKNERHVILCLLEVARRGAKFGMLAPMLVQMERQIDREIAAENKAANGAGAGNEDSDDEYEEMQQEEPCLIYGPQPQIVTNDLKSLDEMVRDLVERCTCPTQFPMIRVSEGKYRIGDTKVLIFVRILRNHVMVRVGGGWDTLSHYLDKHDPCRCRTSHRSTISAKLIQKAGGSFDLGSAQVHYERSPPRTRRSSASSVGSCGGAIQSQSQQPLSLQTSRSVSNNRSRSPTPHRANRQLGEDLRKNTSNRSRSPTPQRKFLGSPGHNAVDLSKQRSRSPTPKTGNLRSRSPTPKVDQSRFGCTGTLDSTRKALNEEIRQVKYDGRSQMYHSRYQDNYQDPKKDLHQEIRAKVPLSEEFSKRYVVEGGVARRTVDKDDSPRYEPSIYNYKCREDSSSRSPTPSPPAIKEEPSEDSESPVTFAKEAQYVKSPQGDGEHSDNGSEVSDEGYRSLGAVQPPPANGTNLNNGTGSTQGSPTVADCHKQPTKTDFERSCVETESIETGLRKTRIGPSSPLRASPSRSVASSSGDRTPRAGSIVRESSNLSRASSGSRTPRDGNSSPEGSPLKRGGGRTSLRKPPTGSLSKASGMPRLALGQNQTSSGSNTWNGRQIRQRPSIQADTFLNPASQATNTSTSSSFSRRSPGRQSLPRPSNGNGPQYDRNGRRIKPSTSLQSSPTKVANPLLEQILQKVGHLEDDKEVVQKLQDFLKDYQGTGAPGNESDPTLEFTRAWIDGNGIVVLPQDVQVVASPRKDPKPASERGGFSRIPAPVYKRPMSVASDSV